MSAKLHDTIKKDIPKLESESNEKYKSLYVRMINARKKQLNSRRNPSAAR